MGFNSGIYTYPKYANCTMSDIHYIETYLEYERNQWAQEHYSSAEDYCEQQYDKTPSDRVTPEAIEFYREHLTTDEFGYKHIFTMHADWCSNGSDLHNWITENSIGVIIETKYSHTTRLSKKDITEIMNHCIEEIESNLPMPASIEYAYRYNRDLDGEIPEIPEITLIPCDGVEVQYYDEDTDETFIKRMDSSSEYGCSLGFPKLYFNDETFYAYVQGLKACAKILAEIDFETNYVIYSGGW